MASDLRHLVFEGMELLPGGLAPFVEMALETKFGDHWLGEVKERYRNYREGDDGGPHWDQQALLVVMELFWNDAFRPAFGDKSSRSVRALVSELIAVRNQVAHNDEFTPIDAERALDNVRRILTAVNANDAADKAHEMWNALRREQISAPNNVVSDNDNPSSSGSVSQSSRWQSGQIKRRVYIPTVEGPAEVQKISRIDPKNPSIMVLGNTLKETGISEGSSKFYHRFSHMGTGVIERFFGSGPFRMAVSQNVSDGESWNLGVFAAHSLESKGLMAEEQDKAGGAVWVTGQMGYDLRVGKVEDIHDKLQTSQSLFHELESNGVPLIIFLPTENIDDITPQLREQTGLEQLNCEIWPIENGEQLCKHLGYELEAQPKISVAKKNIISHRWLTIAAIILLAAIGLVFVGFDRLPLIAMKSPGSSAPTPGNFLPKSGDRPAPIYRPSIPNDGNNDGRSISSPPTESHASSPKPAIPSVDLGTQWDKFD